MDFSLVETVEVDVDDVVLVLEVEVDELDDDGLEL